MEDADLIPYYIFGFFAVIFLGTSPERLMSGPALFYLWGIFYFFNFVFWEHYCGCFRKCLNSKRCCLRKYISTQTAYSYDIYEDLQVDGLKLEYDKNHMMIQEFKKAAESTEITEEDR